jgi:hypothetical protein
MGEETMVEYTTNIGDIPKAPNYKIVIAPLTEEQFWEHHEVLYQRFKERLIKELYTGGITSRGAPYPLPLREYSKLETKL